ncbi:hypothetical protein CFC21_026330 [Triticum aestivum]|uniref:MATH domain-containing protein n=2 Tax=Triticum aestivum TaxID=4565 RepID=A0A9R1EKX4_WHEAT|nr:hypothetical protein CFC21_026330 [Triticum aestivum]
MAAALQMPSTTTTASACVPDTARGTHVFTIASYRLHKGLGAGKFIRSATFAVGGYDWCIRYYPDGDLNQKDHVSVCVELQSKNSVVRALYDLRLINRATGLSSLIFSRPSSLPAFDSLKNDHVRGAYKFMKIDLLEASPYLQDDCLVIQCDITVLLKEIPAVATVAKPPEIQVTPSDLSNNLAKLLEGNKGADMTIKVNDSLPVMHDLDNHDNKEMIKHLIVAADRYAMERMKLICESMLCKSLDAKSVGATLALADQHHCSISEKHALSISNSSLS